MLKSILTVCSAIAAFALSLSPALASECLPPDLTYEFLSEYKGDEGIYKYYAGFENNGNAGQYVVIEDAGKCSLIVSPNDLSSYPLPALDYVLAVDVAQQLYLNLFQNTINDVGGLEAYQEMLDRDENTLEYPFEYISASEEWALTELGVRLSENRRIASSDPEKERIIYSLASAHSEPYGDKEVTNLRINEDYYLADYVQNEEEGVILAQKREEGGVQVLFYGSAEDYNPEQLSQEYQIPLSVLEGLL